MRRAEFIICHLGIVGMLLIVFSWVVGSLTMIWLGFLLVVVFLLYDVTAWVLCNRRKGRDQQ